MIRNSFSVSLIVLLVTTSMNASASAPTPATPDKISIVVEKAEISSDDLTYTTIFDNQTSPVDLTSSTNPTIGQSNSNIPVGTYRVIHLTVSGISWHATWSGSNPSNLSPCGVGDTSVGATGAVDLGGHTDFYFKTPDLGGNTLAYYLANPPSPPAYVGDANHPFVLVSPVIVSKDKTTTINLTIGADHTLTCDAVGVYDRANGTSLRMLSGPKTQYNGLEGVYVDGTNKEIGVINTGNNSVEFFHRTDTGNVPPLPIRTLMGPNTRLNDPEGIVLYQNPTDSTLDEIIVANQASNSLATYSRSAAGNAGPLRTIVGMQTGLNRPAGVALHPDPGGNPVMDEMVVANQGNDSVTLYDRLFSENTAPLRTLSGASTGLSSPCGLYVDGLILMNSISTGNNSPATNILNDLNQNFTPNQFVGLTVGITGGTGQGQVRMITGNTNNQLTVSPSWTTVPDSTSSYRIVENSVGNSLYVANNGSDSVTVYDLSANGNASPKQTIIGSNTGLSKPCGIYVDTIFDEIGVANSGNNKITIYNRTDSGNVTPKRTIAGLSVPRALFLDSTNGEIGVVQQGPQVVMAFAPPIFPSSANQTPSISVLSGYYNVVFYGVDIQGVNGHGIPVPVVFAERGKVTFDPTTSTTSPWPSLSLAVDPQISRHVRRQIIEPTCSTESNFSTTKDGFYGVNDDGSFYAFLPGILGNIQGAFLPDGSAFVGSMVDSSSRLLVVYGLRNTGKIAPYLTTDGTFNGGTAAYAFSSYRNDLFFINRFNDPPTDDLLRFRLGIGGTHTDNTEFIDVDSEVNFVQVLNPMGDLAVPKSAGPIWVGNADTNFRIGSYTSSQGGILNSLLYNLAGALSSDGATLIFMRNTGTVDIYGCPTDIGFGTGLRLAPLGTFGPESLKGTYFMAGFGDQYSPSTQSTFHFSKAETLTFDGAGNVAIRFIHNETGSLSVSQADFKYSVSADNIVNIFDRPSPGPYASANIDGQGRTLVFYQSLNPNGNANPTRLLGLALYQHP